jgi:hypothetical protein
MTTTPDRLTLAVADASDALFAIQQRINLIAVAFQCESIEAVAPTPASISYSLAAISDDLARVAAALDAPRGAPLIEAGPPLAVPVAPIQMH